MSAPTPGSGSANPSSGNVPASRGGNAAWPPATYRVPDGHYDEVRDESGHLRPAWESFVRHAGDLGPARLATLQAQAARRQRENGVTYNVHGGDSAGAARAWTVDPLPVLLEVGEWEGLASALRQRARLLEAMAADFYGERRLVVDGFVPAALLLGHPDFARSACQLPVPGGIRIQQVAFDLGRGADGVWRVIGTRAQNPSGAGYALENRITTARLFPDAFRDMRVHLLARFYRAVQTRLRESAPEADRAGHVVLLTPGPWSETYFEHAFLARYLGFTLAEGADLTVREDRVWLRTLSGLEPVVAVHRRLDDDYCDPLELRSDSALGTAGLLRAWRAGNVVIGNAFGTGVLESPGLYGFLPPLCEHLLGETLEAPSVATWWCGEAAAFEDAAADAGHRILKPAFSGTRMEPVFLAELDEAARAERLAEVRQWPEGFVLQESMALSHVPAWHEGELESRAMMLRVHLVADGQGDYRVLPGALARIAGHGSALVSGQRGGSSKDCWVLAEGPVDPFSILESVPGAVEGARQKRALASRTAENLFWFGRYAERAESRVRMLRAMLLRLLDRESFPAELFGPAVAACREDGLLGSLPDGYVPSLDRSGEEMFERIFSPDHGTGIAYDLVNAWRAAAAARDWMSADSWRLLSALPRDFALPSSRSFADVLSVLDRVVVDLAAVSGLETQRMLRDDGWRVVALGRTVERLVALVGATWQVAVSPLRDEPALLEWLLDVGDATITYRARYRSQPEWAGLCDLMIYDDTNPRSASFLLGSLALDTRRLPEAGLERLCDEIATASRSAADARGATSFGPGYDVADFLLEARGLAFELSDALALRYFRHVEGAHHFTAGI